MQSNELLVAVNKDVCRGCKRPETTIVKLTDAGKLTQTETKICQNPECSFYINAEELTTWKIKHSVHYKRNFYVQHTQKWVRDVKDPE